MRRYILYSTILLIFLDTVAVRTTVMDIKTFYFVFLFNFPYVLLTSLTSNFKLPRIYTLLLSYLWISGLLEVIFGPDQFSLYLKSVIGITVTSFYFYLFFKSQKRSPVEIFDLYARAAVWVSVFGMCLSLVESLVTHAFVPVKSILIEPAAFSTVMLPAFYYYASMGKLCDHSRQRMWAILVAILLSISSVGILGILLAVAFLFRRKAWGLFYAPVILGSLFVIAYGSNEQFRLRIDDTVQGSTTLNLRHVNLSTYALLSNAYVASRALQERPILGYGIGGHAVAHSKYLGDLWEFMPAHDSMINLNNKDAASLFLRTMSELGLVGIALIVFFIIKFRTSGNTVNSNISTAIFIYFCMILLRAGEWFDPEMYFFVWLYIYVFRQSAAVGFRDAQVKVAYLIKMPQVI